MGYFQIILGIVFIVAALSLILGQYFSLLILVAIIAGVLLLIIRLLAMFYWWGRDKGEW
jgi:hypothetical protein